VSAATPVQTRSREQVILLLDDDYNITEALACGLERSDRSVITCNDLESAQLFVERFKPSIIVSDVRLSGEFGCEGLEFISFAQRHVPGARVIMMTGDAPERLQLEAAQRGAVAFLQKPFDTSELGSLIDLMAPQSDWGIEMPALIRMPLLDDVISSTQLGTGFQPIVDLHRGWAPIGYESLARFSSDSPLHDPALLFQYASRKHRVSELELACIQRTFSSGARLMQSTNVFINVHPEVLKLGPQFRDFLCEQASLRNVSLDHIVLELTEQGSLSEDPRVFKLIDALRAEGIRFAFDDVGVAYSHLPYIHRVRPEFLKISQDFGTAFEADPTRRKLVTNLVSLARDFHCSVILEGIEDLATAQAAVELGIEFGQGFMFGRPADVSRYAAENRLPC
jgi:EAL domain-containing protein (putative c-di-GMP-specific phosphodiesterase class I)/ActR/RegA family two-component response regulator